MAGERRTSIVMGGRDVAFEERRQEMLSRIRADEEIRSAETRAKRVLIELGDTGTEPLTTIEELPE